MLFTDSLRPFTMPGIMFRTVKKSIHCISHQDQMLVDAVENYVLQLCQFNHAIHVKLAYCYLSKLGMKAAKGKMQTTLKKYLAFNGVSANKFHMTLTHGWLIAVWHFMSQSEPCASTTEFLKQNPVLLNKDILLAHYSQELLFSDRARRRFVEPDLNAFPAVSC